MDATKRLTICLSLNDSEFIVCFKSSNMKWNAIITKSQYEKTLSRKVELSHALPGSKEEDELALLLILIKDYENRHMEVPGTVFRIQVQREMRC